MYILADGMWFTKLIRQFFFWLDQIVYNSISAIYDLLTVIARTSILTQSDIADMASRIYMLLTVFMIFKVTLSLITYVVNPDDFSDKTKGVSKLGTNIIISLAMLILTPYIFNYAYELQTIILEDNSLATLILGGSTEEENSFFNSAGDDMAYITMSAFFTPNVSITKLKDCVTLLEPITDEEGNKKYVFNSDCSGMDKDYNPLNDEDSLYALTKAKNGVDGSSYFSETTLKNYIAGVNNNSLGLLFRQDLVTATDPDNENFIMEYKWVFSTVVGVIIILLLVTFCMDIAVRSIKLAFLQLAAPIPILSYVDPKSGKDGLFKKWYEMCFKTYLSLFIRLIVLYFVTYIINKLADADMGLVDVIDGSYITNPLVKIFIIIGALMFAKQLPKILEGLGFKLDGDGKFTLNPIKKIEEGAVFGKNITGMARGAMVGTMGAASGAGWGRGFSGAWRGLTSGKGWKETGKAEIEMNRKMRQAMLDGSTFFGRTGAKLANAMGIPTQSEQLEAQIHEIDENIKDIDNNMAPSKKLAQEKKLYTDAVSAMEKRAIEKIENGEAGVLSEEYRRREAKIEALKAQLDQAARTPGADTSGIQKLLAKEKIGMQNYLNDTAMKIYLDANSRGKDSNGKNVYGENVTEDGRIVVGKDRDENPIYAKDVDGNDIKVSDIFGKDAEGEAKSDAALTTMRRKMQKIVETYGSNPEHQYMADGSASELHANLGRTKEEITVIENNNEESEKRKRDLEESKKQLYDEQRTAKANESTIK